MVVGDFLVELGPDVVYSIHKKIMKSVVDCYQNYWWNSMEESCITQELLFADSVTSWWNVSLCSVRFLVLLFFIEHTLMSTDRNICCVTKICIRRWIWTVSIKYWEWRPDENCLTNETRWEFSMVLFVQNKHSKKHEISYISPVRSSRISLISTETRKKISVINDEFIVSRIGSWINAELALRAKIFHFLLSQQSIDENYLTGLEDFKYW